MRRTAITLSSPVTASEFRLFARGINATSKGDFLFDDAAARSVMAAYRRQGTDVMIDLEHDSLSDRARASRADAANAMGWAKLELRNGELWAVNVRWTPDGSERLAKKTQRYVSPAFLTDDAGRVIEIVNVALVAMPATHNAPALVAASRKRDAASRMLSLRISTRLVRLLDRKARREGVSRSEVLRRIVKRLTAAVQSLKAIGAALGVEPEPEAIQSAADALFARLEADGPLESEDVSALEDLAAALGLTPEARVSEVRQALLDALAEATAEVGDPLGDSAEPPPARVSRKAPSQTAGLSRVELAALAKITDPAQRRNFLALRKQRAADRARTAPKEKRK